ncbi:MAG TPA: cbb3-type cytochrome c oxidase subunit I, partial [Acidimicrobiales bacterium]|nr:cbb3-type cytochrome c oxidase subunit I [Acidimicrobiales bacterium]
MTISAERPTQVDDHSPVSPVAVKERKGFGSGWQGQHLGTAIIAGFLGYIFGHWLGNYIASSYTYIANSGQNSVADLLALVFMVVGWYLGIGALNYPLAKLTGREATHEVEYTGFSKYFRYNLDHKVVGLQYVVGVLLFLFTGGLLAMAIRTELLNPTTHIFSADTYIKIVSEHGTIMMMMATSVVVGPLGNYFIPLMIGARRMAFPRIEAFSFWTFLIGYVVIFSALPYGGFPTGWTGYAPLQTQAGPGMISYLFGFAIIGVGMMTAGFNLAITVINYRAPGMTWSRVPVFVWGILSTAALLTLATPVLF